MSFNLLDLVKDQLTDSLVEKAAGFIGESKSGTTSAIASLVPSLIGSLINKSEEKDGPSGIMSLLNTDGLAGVAGNLSSLFGGDSASLNLGNSLITSLLGDKVGSLVGLISKVSGIGENSSSSLLKMATPLLLGTLASKVKGGGLNVAGLKDLLFSQKDSVKAALPASFASTMGFSNLFDKAEATVKTATAAATSTVNTAATKSEGGFKKILPFLLLALLGVLGFLLLKKCKGGETAPTTEINADSLTVDTNLVETTPIEVVTEDTTTVVEPATTTTTVTSSTTTVTAPVTEATTTFKDIDPNFVSTTLTSASVKAKYGINVDGGTITAMPGTTVENTTIDGVNVTTYKFGKQVTRVYKDNDGVETVVVQDEKGLTFFQKIGNALRSISSMFAASKTKIKAGSLVDKIGGGAFRYQK